MREEEENDEQQPYGNVSVTVIDSHLDSSKCTFRFHIQYREFVKDVLEVVMKLIMI